MTFFRRAPAKNNFFQKFLANSPLVEENFSSSTLKQYKIPPFFFQNFDLGSSWGRGGLKPPSPGYAPVTYKILAQKITTKKALD